MTLLLLFNQPSSVPAFLRADADDAIADWINEAGTATNLFASIDEVSVDDADFIQSPAPPNTSVARFRVSNPAAGKKLISPIIVRYRFKKLSASDQTLVVSLKQNTTLIASWTHTSTGLTTSFQTAAQTLSGGQVAAITDFDSLFIEFQAS